MSKLLAYPPADFGRLIRLAHREMEREMLARLHAAGYEQIHPRHLTLLRALSPDEAGTALSVLARDAGVTRQAVQQVADELERLGVVESLADPRDGRVRLIRYTEWGRGGYAVNLRILTELEVEYTELLGPRTMAAAKRLLTAISSRDSADPSDPESA
jgi:DNA-binding MarR family transcriptional regulator